MSFRSTSIRFMVAKSKQAIAAENQAKLRAANEEMKKYYQNSNPVQLLEANRRRSATRESEHKLQMGFAAAFIVALFTAPFLGKRIAKDEEFRKDYIPAWFDYSMPKSPKSEFSRDELIAKIKAMQKEMDEKRLSGELTDEKLQYMSRHFEGTTPETDIYGWGKFHPGVEDDEDVDD